APPFLAVRAGYGPHVRRESADEGVLADHVDDARQAARRRVDRRDRLAREHVHRRSTGDANAAGDIRRRVRQTEWRQLASECNALLQLAQVCLVQAIGQLRLPGEYDVQQFHGVGLEITEQAHFLEQLVRQALRFVEQQGSLATAF